MFALFRFDLPRGVTEQLLEKIDELKSSTLTPENLSQLIAFQREVKLNQGVYVLYLKDKVVYVGKSDNVFGRLSEHWEKVRGRRHLKLGDVAFKCFLLDDNWKPSANENLLIDHFRDRGECEWNLGGFGPKDPGRNRDGGEASVFDTTYPINEDCPLEGLRKEYTAGELLELLKTQLPFLLRFKIGAEDAAKTVNVSGVAHTAKALLVHIATTLGKDWQLMLFKSHMTLYRERKVYANGEQLAP